MGDPWMGSAREGQNVTPGYCSALVAIRHTYRVYLDWKPKELPVSVEKGRTEAQRGEMTLYISGGARNSRQAP